MIYKWIGAILVILCCGGCGLGMVAEQRRQERLLGQLVQAVRLMQWELQYRLTALPELCRLAGREVTGGLRPVFQELASELDRLAAPEVCDCMKKVLSDHQELPRGIRRLLHQLGRTLGRFDLPGQMQGLTALETACQREADRLEKNRESRSQSCRTLGFCAGAALVILFI